MQTDVNHKLELLKNEYAKQLPIKLREIEQQWQLICHNQAVNLWSHLIRNTHSLCGTAGTYGFTILSAVAKRLEIKLDGMSDKPLNNESMHQVTGLIQDLKQVSMELPDRPLISFNQLKKVTPHGKRREIYIVGPDKESLTQQFIRLNNYNYSIRIYANINELQEAVAKQIPGMIVLDTRCAAQLSYSHVKRWRDHCILLIYVSHTDGLSERLAAIRHGGQAFMLMSAEVETTIRSIENLFHAARPQSERVLIVDDSEFLTRYYSLILNSVGMLVETVNDPRLFLNLLQEFQPDIIIMDINMPYVNGTELAQVVQQQENLSGIPIIFLSTISEKSQQFEALSYAGDDFLTKPIEPKYLIAAVRNRLMRSRIIRSRMIRDSLTNLYNHTMIHHQLERELSIAERYKKKVCIALIDIDYFKIVNDTYGHQAGDKILYELSNYLQRHLRISDVVGRYGGEEFLIVLPNTCMRNAFCIINQLRGNFADIHHQVGANNICVSFSAGIAQYPDCDNMNKLIKASDEALYLAKKMGRNRVVCSD